MKKKTIVTEFESWRTYRQAITNVAEDSRTSKPQSSTKQAENPSNSHPQVSGMAVSNWSKNEN